MSRLVVIFAFLATGCFNFELAFSKYCEVSSACTDAGLDGGSADASEDAGRADASLGDAGTADSGTEILLGLERIEEYTLLGLSAPRVWGREPNSVWVGGFRGTEEVGQVFYWNGLTWTQKVDLTSGERITDIDGQASGPVYFARLNGSIDSWTPLGWRRETQTDGGFLPPQLFGLHISSDEKWACGDDGLILSASDGGWLHRRVSTSDVSFKAIARSGAYAAAVGWQVGNANAGMLVERTADGGWHSVFGALRESLTSLWVFDERTAIAVGDHGKVLLRIDGQWVSEANPPTQRDFSGIWAPGPNDVWLVSDETVLHRTANGYRTFTFAELGVQHMFITDVFGFGMREVWVVGIELVDAGVVTRIHRYRRV